MLSRRQLLKLGLFGVPALTLKPKFSSELWADNNVPSSPRITPFQTELPRPPVIQPVHPSIFPPPAPPLLANTDYFLVSQQKADIPVFPSGPRTVMWTYNGLFPGPTFVVQKNRQILVRQINNLNEPNTSTTHLHGAHTPSVSDGGAFTSQIVAPGQFKDYIYPNDDTFGHTLFYHDHFLDFTGRNLFMGLAGFYLLQDQFEHDLVSEGKLPGPEFDIGLLLQDRQFDADNQLVYNTFDHDGFLGDRFLVNGVIQPKLTVANRRYRFRVLNGANARFYGLALSTGDTFTIIASDQGLLRHPVTVNKLIMGMAERYEIVVDFSKYPLGTRLFLLNAEQQSKGRGPDGFDLRAAVPILRFDVDINDPEVNPVPIPDPLRTDLVLPQATDVVKTRTFEFERSDGAWQVNGRFYDENRIDANPRLNTTERWIFKNGGGGWFHPIHTHDQGFSIVKRNGRTPPGQELGLKDVVALAGGDVVETLIHFEGANNLGKYNIHCHNTEHEDMRMMIRFDVVP
jgi:FtsP/CotA-like multicopper oxidase with cupredoxin domain